MIAPLTKRKGDGTLYQRPEHIEQLLQELDNLPRDELLKRAEVRSRSDPSFVPPECLVYFLRASRHDNSEAWFERLYKVVLERVTRSVPRQGPGNSTMLTRERIRDKVIDRFVELVAEDRKSGENRLDFFEAKFAKALMRLRQDAQAKAWREENRNVSYDDAETAIEKDSGSVVIDQFAENISSDPIFRRRLSAAISELPPKEGRTMHLLLLGWPMESSDPEVMSIAKALKCSDRSVRNYKERALEKLIAHFNQRDAQ